MAEESSSSNSLEHTPTWVVAVVCFVIVLISFCAERGLHELGKFLKKNKQDALFEALQKLKEELMLLGFISLLLTVFQDVISHMCIPTYLASHMLPCKMNSVSHEKFSLGTINNRRQLLSEDTSTEHCAKKGKTPLLSLEALHQLHIFIFVLAVTHVIFCATTMVLAGAKIRQWKHWEDSVRNQPQLERDPTKETPRQHHFEFLNKRAIGYWRKAAVVSWLISFFKQFYGSVTKSDYISLRQGFIMAHCPTSTSFDFHKYMMRTLEWDFRKLLLLVGAKLEHIITRLAQDVDPKRRQGQDAGRVKPSDEYFWFQRPAIVLNLIHFILFQNSFEIAFVVWIWCTYGFQSCIMEKLGYIIPRLIIGAIVQVLCSYSTLPLYAIVTQMGGKFKKGIFDDFVQSSLDVWLESSKSKGETSKRQGSISDVTGTQLMKMTTQETNENAHVAQEMLPIEETTISITKLSSVP
ncbi:hypothetical protein WN943_005700 [Citrus x changshan-huyou]